MTLVSEQETAILPLNSSSMGQVQSTSKIRVERIGTVEDLQSLKAQWEVLVKGAGTNTIFQTHEWLVCWWKNFSQEHQELLVLVALEDHIVRGIAPLMYSGKNPTQKRKQVVQFLGTGSSDYCDFIVEKERPDVLVSLLDWLVREQGQWDFLDLSDLPGTSPHTQQAQNFFQEQGLYAYTRILYDAPTIVLGNTDEDQKLLKKKSLRRHFNYFNKHGTLTFRNIENMAEAMKVLDVLFLQHIERRSLTDTPSLFLDEKQKEFFRDVTRLILPTGWLVLSIVEFNEKIIAVHFGFEYAKRFIWYKPAFNIEYVRHSPGEVLIKYLLEYAIQRQADEFDFTIGDEDFKYRFANCIRQNSTMRVFRHATPYYRETLGYQVRSYCKQIPLVVTAIKKIRKFFG